MENRSRRLRSTSMPRLLAATGPGPPSSPAPAQAPDAGMAGLRRAIRRASHYSPLADINRDERRAAGRGRGSGGRQRTRWPEFGTRPGNFQNTPLMIDNVLYVSTPYNRVVALDAETGKELWSYDPKAYEDGQPPNGTGFVHRGVAAWRASTGSAQAAQTAHLHEQPLPADRARREDRRADLVVRHERRRRSHAGPAARRQSAALHQHVAAGRLSQPRHSRERRRRSADVQAAIRPATCARSTRAPASRSGASTPCPAPGETGPRHVGRRLVEDAGHTNVWAPMSLDEARGLLYLPVSTPSNDFYGGDRPGANLFGESLVCLDAATGAPALALPDRASRPVGLRPARRRRIW